MKEKWTKLGKTLLSLTLVASLLAGCGGGGNSSSGSNSGGEQSSGGSGVSSEVAAEDSNFNETGLPIVNEPVELTFLYVKGANPVSYTHLDVYKRQGFFSTTV